MKVYDGGKIFIGLIIFVVIFAAPFYLNTGKAIVKPELKIDTPEIQKLIEKQCVESKAFMRAEHMTMLNEWRDAVVREGNRFYENSKGKHYEMSLQNTCMKCHSNKKNFCDKCHNYAAVKPYCWDCHIAPKENEL